MDLVRQGDVEVPWITLGELIRDKARRNGAKEIARFEDGRTLTSESLNVRSDSVAGALTELGVRAGDRVATLLYNSPEQLVVWFATAKLGAIFVPINVSLRGLDLAHVIRQSTPRVMIVGADLRTAYESASVESAFSIGAVIWANDDQSGVTSFAELEAAGNVPPSVEVAPSDPVSILFTGGTTGLPKGVVRPHFSYMCVGVRYQQVIRPTPDDRHYASTHLFHCGGQEIAFIGPLLNDIPTFFPRWFSARDFWPQARQWGATIMDGLGPVLALLLRQPPKIDDLNNPIRIAWAAAQSVPLGDRTEFQRRFGVRLLEIYGLTETGSFLLSNHVDDERVGSVGKPRGWCDIRVVNDGDHELATGEEGELVIRPTIPFSMSLGYHAEPQMTMEHWRNLWIHTGDVGYEDGEGWIYLTGRRSHWMRVRGENVTCLEVEQVINAHPAVIESAVVGVPSDLADDEIKAFIVVRYSISAAQLADWCASRLAYFKVPRFFVFIEELPRSAAKNEIERHRLRDQGIGDAWDRVAAGYRLSRGGKS